MKYGALPVDLGLIDLRPVEMMFWLYCPISTPTSGVVVPDNLVQFQPIIDAVMEDDLARFRASYVYLTAKTLFVTPDNIGNRPGWHSDGFGTDDLNFIWYDRAPTEFVDGAFSLPTDCDESMIEMARHADLNPWVVYPNRHLLKLDQRVIHRSPVNYGAGMRTFVKVSISSDRYDLAGNSINHGLDAAWPLVARKLERNHPSSAKQAAVKVPGMNNNPPPKGGE